MWGLRFYLDSEALIGSEACGSIPEKAKPNGTIVVLSPTGGRTIGSQGRWKAYDYDGTDGRMDGRMKTAEPVERKFVSKRDDLLHRNERFPRPTIQYSRQQKRREAFFRTTDRQTVGQTEMLSQCLLLSLSLSPRWPPPPDHSPPP